MSWFWMIFALAFVAAAVLAVVARRTGPGRQRVFLWIAAASALAFPAAVILHNAVDAVFHVEEPVFFLLALFGAPAGLIVGLVGAAYSALAARPGGGSRA